MEEDETTGNAPPAHPREGRSIIGKAAVDRYVKRSHLQLFFEILSGIRETERSSGHLVVLASELIDPATGIDNLLLAGIKRMAGRTHFNMQLILEGRACHKLIATAADDFDFLILRVNFRFHNHWLHGRLTERPKKGAENNDWRPR